MDKSTADILDLVLERLDSKLLDEAHRDKIKSLVSDLPLLNHGIIEMYSRPKSRRVDLMLCVQKIYGEHEALNHYIEQFNQEVLNKLFQQWTDKSQMIAGVLENLYLVYDIEDLNKSILPWPYLAFSRLTLDSSILVSIFKSASQSLDGLWDDYIESKLLSCLSYATPNLHVFGFGMLQGRNAEGFRIGVANFNSIQQVAEYLEQIAYDINYDEFLSSFAYVDEYAESYVLSLVLDEKLNNSFGIECIISKNDNKEVTRKFLERLGVEDIDSLLHAIRQEHSVNTWINHIKLNCKGTNIVGVKPYLYYELI